uniref:Uncharacterized protein n=1 Tax=Physcomitrium patens TaxID=3218 RepID=A0A2K1KKC1_PHYPA|nr:hypothetical protein PHYPA_007896 [Physcomitrium patens]
MMSVVHRRGGLHWMDPTKKRYFERELDNIKHEIFLSHSGEQKDFVYQLCKDLKTEAIHSLSLTRATIVCPKARILLL